VQADQFAAAEATTAQAQVIALRVFGPQSVQLYDVLELRTENAYRKGDFNQAIALSEALLKQALSLFGPLHARTVDAKYARVQALVGAEKSDQAEALVQSAVDDLDKVFPTPNKLYEQVLTVQAAVQYQVGKVDESAATMERINQLYRGPLKGSSGRNALLNNLAAIRVRQFRLPEALALAQEGLAVAIAAYGAKHTEVADAHRISAQILARMERYGEAAASYHAALAIYLAAEGEKSVHATKIELNLADLAVRQKQGAVALGLLDRTLIKLRLTNDETSRDVVEARMVQGQALLLVGKPADALRVLTGVVADVRGGGATIAYVLPVSLVPLARAQLLTGAKAQARASLQEALALRRAEKPVNEKAISKIEALLLELR
jgi:eukaryotic-like serine/threonine-protein kinase